MIVTLGKACVLAALLAIGCGGRTLDGGEADDGTGGSGGSGGTGGAAVDAGKTSNAPTCTDICRRAVDVCFPGGSIDQCTRDCETMRTQYKGCLGLDEFLKCRVAAPVRCSTNEVILEGCTEELNRVVRCRS